MPAKPANAETDLGFTTFFWVHYVDQSDVDHGIRPQHTLSTRGEGVKNRYFSSLFYPRFG
jgi:hypothetical protein